MQAAGSLNPPRPQSWSNRQGVCVVYQSGVSYATHWLFACQCIVYWYRFLRVCYVLRTCPLWPACRMITCDCLRICICVYAGVTLTPISTGVWAAERPFIWNNIDVGSRRCDKMSCGRGSGSRRGWWCRRTCVCMYACKYVCVYVPLVCSDEEGCGSLMPLTFLPNHILDITHVRVWKCVNMYIHDK